VSLVQGKSAKDNKPVDANPDPDAAAKAAAKPAAKSKAKSKSAAKSESKPTAKPSDKPAAKRNAKLHEKGAVKKRSASPRKTKAVDAIAATSSSTSKSQRTKQNPALLVQKLQHLASLPPHLHSMVSQSYLSNCMINSIGTHLQYQHHQHQDQML